MKRKFLSLILALVLVCSLSLVALVGCGGNKDNEKEPEGTNPPATQKATSYVALDINPSVELILDENNVVMSARGENEDAKVLLYGEDGIVGADVNVAVEKIGKLSTELKYINEDNKAINVTIASSVEGNDKNLESNISLSLNKGAGVELSIKADGNYSLQREFEAFKEKYKENADVAKMTIAQYRLAMEAMAADATLKVEEVAKMSVDKLVDVVSDAREDAIEFAIDALPKAEQAIVKVAENAYKFAIERLETSAYLAVDLANAPVGTALNIAKMNDHIQFIVYKNIALTLEDINDAIEIARESAEQAINDADIKVIFDTLVEKGVITAEEGETADQAVADEKAKADTNKDGKLTLDEVDAYLDKVLKNVADEVADQVEDALDATMEALDDAYEEYIPEEVKTKIANAKTELVNTIKEEIGEENIAKLEKIGINVEKTIKGLIDELINLDPVAMTTEYLENIEEDAEDKADHHEERIVERMGKTEGLLDKVEAYKDNLNNNEKVLEAKKAFEDKLHAEQVKASEALKNAKAERKAA